MDDAALLEEAGVFGILLECVPAKVSTLIAERAKIPVIGTGSGCCDGQSQIFPDMFNMFHAFMPKHAKRYGDVAQVISDGVTRYVQEVHSGAFPEPQHTFSISDDQYAELLGMIAK
jgi:3-methyl-2-oxobutanoate hydroxymethyltransferase